MRGIVVSAPFCVERFGESLKRDAVKLSEEVLSVAAPEDPERFLFIAVYRKFKDIGTFRTAELFD